MRKHAKSKRSKKLSKSNEQKPLCRVGTEFPCGKVVAIKRDGVDIETSQGVKRFSFTQVERFINDARTV